MKTRHLHAIYLEFFVERREKLFASLVYQLHSFISIIFGYPDVFSRNKVYTKHCQNKQCVEVIIGSLYMALHQLGLHFLLGDSFQTPDDMTLRMLRNAIARVNFKSIAGLKNFEHNYILVDHTSFGYARLQSTDDGTNTNRTLQSPVWNPGSLFAFFGLFRQQSIVSFANEHLC